jgi:hypothetical protein
MDRVIDRLLIAGDPSASPSHLLLKKKKRFELIDQ